MPLLKYLLRIFQFLNLLIGVQCTQSIFSSSVEWESPEVVLNNFKSDTRSSPAKSVYRLHLLLFHINCYLFSYLISFFWKFFMNFINTGFSSKSWIYMMRASQYAKEKHRKQNTVLTFLIRWKRCQETDVWFWGQADDMKWTCAGLQTNTSTPK